MTKILLIVPSIFIVLYASGQMDYSLTARPVVGYEFNMLKSPSSYQGSSVDLMGRRQLWKNASLAGGSLKFSLRSLNKRHAFGVSSSYLQAIPGGAQFTKSNDIQAGGHYLLKKNRIKNKVGLQFKSLERPGEDFDNLLGIPLSYTRFSVQDEFTLKSKKYLSFHLTPRMVMKNYRRNGFEAFSYREHGAVISMGYRYLLKKKFGVRYGLSIKRRNYLIAKKTAATVDNEGIAGDSIAETFRNWNYYGAHVGIKSPIGKKIKLLANLGYTYRQDVSDNQLGYREFALGTEFKYTRKKLKAQIGMNFRHRQYTTFTVNEEIGGLIYDYFQYGFGLAYKVHPKLSITLDTQFKSRISNGDHIQRRTLRSYHTGFSTIGVKWIMKGKSKSTIQLRK